MTTNNAKSGAGMRVELQAINKRYASIDAVKDVNLIIEAGEFMTFLGPSGSGKTTTLNLIAGFADLNSGAILIGGQPMQSVPAHKRNLGVVFQSYALFPHMSVWNNIAFPLEQRQHSKTEQRELISQVLKLVELNGFESRMPSELSGGQQQRVALARALVFNPNVLLLDEPLGALDKKLREWLQGELKRIHSSLGSTFIFVTHDQEEALSLSDRIAIFNRGRIEQVGTGQDLYERPETLFVGQFLGDSTILRGIRSGESSHSSILDFGGVSVTAPKARRASQNILLLRPEKISLTAPTGAAESGVNRIPATVSQRTYLGSSWRYDVTLGDGKPGIVRQGPAERMFEPGAQVDLVWSAADGVLLDADDSSGASAA
ncbi:ABC transporter ATP-binding protein [Shinella granuli]|uniref:Putative spermidine/putrescine transport system ATP-binding protein n=1 Tax=Shinella granuli TaxID=323621 RepID=A0A4R2C3N2_SHIGR|nr:ABC transporter ATP-binding protein [Shinella granuli]TCN34343.1 putative spermidine/putrescine transport system ATP-binding protein [Shinella granuli]